MKQLARQEDAQAQMLTQYKGKTCFGWQAHPPADMGTPRYILDNFAESNQTLGRIWVMESVRGQNKQKRSKATALRAQRSSNNQQFQHLPCRDCNN